MTAARQIKLLSIEEYLSRERTSREKHEYTGGYVHAMAGGKNIHNTIAGAFFGASYTRLRGRPCQPFNSDTKVRIRFPSHTRFYYPDGMIVCEANPGDDEFQDLPVVLAEVLSPSTRRTDEAEKREAYLTIPALSAYLLIETTRPYVVVHHRTSDGFVPHVYEGLDAVVPLNVVGIEIPLAELYERVDFAAAAAEWAVENDELSR
jgi:Uma2 family endonuclease